MRSSLYAGKLARTFQSSTKRADSSGVSRALGLSSTIGLFLEKFILITPVVPVNLPVVALEALLMLVLVILVYRGRDAFMPQMVTAAGADRPHAPRHGKTAPAP